MTHSFSIGEAFKFGWEKTKAHSGLMFQMMLTLFAVQVVSAIVTRTLHGTLLGSLANIALIILGLFVGVGLTLVALRIAEGKHAGYADLYPNWLVVLKYMCANILAAIIVVVPLAIGGAIALFLGFGSLVYWEGSAVATPPTVALAVAVVIFIAAIVLAAYLAMRYMLVRYAILDGMGIIESLSKSATYSRGVKWKLLWFVILFVILNLIGVVLLLVGLLITVPITLLASAHVYLKLKSHHHAA